jgi:hypothetical protein
LGAASVAFFVVEDLKPGGIVTAALGGTFVVAGTTLLITGGIRLKKEKAERTGQAFLPAIHPKGFGWSYTRVF